MTNIPNPPNDPDRTAAPEAPAEARAEAPAPAQPTRLSLRDSVLGFRGVLAVALASLILGGLGGAAIGVLASGDGDGDRRGPREGPWPGGDLGPGGRPGMMPNGGMPNGGMPPAVPQEDEPAPDDSVTPSAPAGSGTNS